MKINNSDNEGKNMPALLQKINKTQTPEQLCEILDLEFVEADISYRGGNLGFSGADIADLVDVDEHLLPSKFGVYCNYLGGGLRGAICASGFSIDVPEEKAEILDAISKSCRRAYEYYENQSHLNDEEYPDGETNWEAEGTDRIRNAGIVSAY